VVQRKQEEESTKTSTAITKSKGEALLQKVNGFVVRISHAGYGVIKSAEWGEVMWRQYELPTNVRTLQLSDKAKFIAEVEKRGDFARLKAMEGQEVTAELYKLPDGQVRASHVRCLHQQPMLQNEHQSFVPPTKAASQAPPAPAEGAPKPGAPGQGGQGMMGMPPNTGMPGMSGMMPGMPPGMSGMPGMPFMPPGMDPAQMAKMQEQWMRSMMGKKPKKDKKEKKKKDKKRTKSEDSGGRGVKEEPGRFKRRKVIDDDDF
jgi:hypothetical protein